MKINEKLKIQDQVKLLQSYPKATIQIEKNYQEICKLEKKLN